MTSYLRTNYRISGNKIDSASLAVAAGSSHAAANAADLGSVAVAHGLSTTPTFVRGIPVVTDMYGAMGKTIALVNVGATNATFVVASALITSQLATLMTSAISNSVTMTFVWVAFG